MIPIEHMLTLLEKYAQSNKPLSPAQARKGLKMTDSRMTGLIRSLVYSQCLEVAGRGYNANCVVYRITDKGLEVVSSWLIIKKIVYTAP